MIYATLLAAIIECMSFSASRSLSPSMKLPGDSVKRNDSLQSLRPFLPLPLVPFQYSATYLGVGASIGDDLSSEIPVPIVESITASSHFLSMQAYLTFSQGFGNIFIRPPTSAIELHLGYEVIHGSLELPDIQLCHDIDSNNLLKIRPYGAEFVLPSLFAQSIYKFRIDSTKLWLGASFSLRIPLTGYYNEKLRNTDLSCFDELSGYIIDSVTLEMERTNVELQNVVNPRLGVGVVVAYDIQIPFPRTSSPTERPVFLTIMFAYDYLMSAIGSNDWKGERAALNLQFSYPFDFGLGSHGANR